MKLCTAMTVMPFVIQMLAFPMQVKRRSISNLQQDSSNEMNLRTRILDEANENVMNAIQPEVQEAGVADVVKRSRSKPMKKRLRKGSKRKRTKRKRWNRRGN